ncbi:hypothetical protein UCREL1_10209 [Eutypa lata UCREL1]|uniref:Ubiquitin-like domain-containing protein n=1 Tax=Eutypa lata (strain UCR-EL1) TaxID=1287681 RepID=M7SZ37_EUTLA|nr:hypothetical protein UCREL1_10209 [Eutypa lata UCREL1]
MEDPQPPSANPKKKLLFKRTIQRKSAEKPKDDDDGLSLFSRSNEFFPTVIKDREREAAEKAAKAEKERKEKLERDQKAKELFRHKESEGDAEDDETPSAKKRRRRHLSLSDNDSDDGFTTTTTTKPHKSRKSSTITPVSPTTKRESFGRDSVARTPRSTRSSRRNGNSSAVITLGSSDDEDTKDVKPLFSPLGHRHKPSPVKRQESLEESDLELSLPGGVDGGDENFNCYIQGAMERAEKRKRERLEREAAGSGVGGANNNTTAIATTSTKNGGGAGARSVAAAATAAANDEPTVQILISSAIEGIAPIVFKRKLHQPLAVVHSTWVEQQVAKHAPLPRAVLQDMFFTWRGDKVYQTTTLETLGIRPDASGDGSLWKPRWGERERDPPEGYHGRDKVHFEAWTQDMYEKFQRRRERERRRDRGELVSDGEDEEGGGGGGGDNNGEGGSGNGNTHGNNRSGSGEAGAEGRGKSGEPEPQKNVKIILKARGMDPENVKVRPSTTIAMLAVVFKRLKKLPAENAVELHWDGEVLDPDSTIEDAEMEDMDSIEVHIK